MSLKEDLAEIKTDIKELREELKEVLAWVNRAKGWGAAGLLVVGALGGAIGKFITEAWKG